MSRIPPRDLQTNEDLFRFSAASRVAPDPPRGLKLDDATGEISWEAPFNTLRVTHYRIYLNTDDISGLFAEVSVGQRHFIIVPCTDVFVSSYNKPLDTESSLIRLGRGWGGIVPEGAEELRPPYPWCPRLVDPITGDSIVDPTEWTFELSEEHESLRDGTSYAKLVISGHLPVNSFSDVIAPVIADVGVVGLTGGTIEGAKTYYAAVCAVDADGLLSKPSNVSVTEIATAGFTYQLTLFITTWPSGGVGFRVYIGDSPYRLTQVGGESLVVPGTITINTYPVWDFGIPDELVRHLVFRIKRIEHSGVWALPVTSVSAGTLEFPGAGMTVNEWAGRDVTLLAKAGGIGLLVVANFLVASNTADNLVVTPDPVGIVDAGDVVVMRSKGTLIGADYIEDSLWVNPLSPPGTGLAIDAEKRNVLRIIAGKGRGDIYWIASNTATRLVVEDGWITGRVPDFTTRYIVERPEWLGSQESQLLVNQDPDAQATFNVQVTNWEQQTVLVQGLTKHYGLVESPEAYSPIREIFLFGGPGPAVNVKDRVINPTGILELFDGTDPAQGTIYTSFPIEVGESVEIFAVHLTVHDPPAGADIILDITRSDDNGTTWTTSIFTTPPHIVAGSRETIITSLVTNPVVGDIDTWLRLTCTQIGSTFAGANLRCMILYRVIGI